MGDIRQLEGRSVRAINSHLNPSPERPDPKRLPENARKSFQGTIVRGLGFVLTPEERAELVARNPRNAERIFPYLGGKEVNTSPTQSYHRHVISFEQMSLAEAEQWPDLMQIVRAKVKPERDRVKQDDHRKYWWGYANRRPGLYAAIAPLKQCLVTALVTKHLCFSFQPTDRIFSHKLYVFPLQSYTPFAILQSKVHEAWARLLSATLETRLSYTATDCFATFPFPDPDPGAIIPALEDIGKRLYDERAQFMLDTNQGLTKTYNALKDPQYTGPRVAQLRRLHEELDRAVLEAYGWGDLSPGTERFEALVLDRLMQLNELR